MTSGTTTEATTTELANGIVVVTEAMPEARSVACGFWVSVGARDEPAELAGASHFLEHLLFKGTDSRTARQIAEAVDRVGGEMNAFTAKEHTAFYTRLPDRDLGLGLELLADVLSAPAFRPHEVEAERQVILEELAMSADEPADRAHTLLAEALFGADHPLGREVLGTATTVEFMGREQIRAFFTDHYRPANLVVAAAGRLDHDTVVAAVAERFEVEAPDRVLPALTRAAPTDPPVPVLLLHRPTEQVHLALGWRTFGRHDEDRFALAVANQVLGGSTSSRLFQEVREDRGLAYEIYSAISGYDEVGALVIEVGSAPARARQVLDVIDAEVARMADEPVSAEELGVAMGYLEGSMLLGLEDSGGRMARLGSSQVTRGRLVPVGEYLDRIRSVTATDVRRVAGRVLGGPRSLAAVGPPSMGDLAA